MEMPPTPPQSRRESGAAVVGALGCREVLNKKGGRKGGGGGEKAEWDHREFGTNEAHPPGRQRNIHA